MSNNIIQITLLSNTTQGKRIIINKTQSIKQLYQKIRKELQIPRGLEIVIVHDGSPVDEESSETIESYHISHNSTLDLRIPLCSSQPVEAHETEETRQLAGTKSHISVKSSELLADLKFLVEGECCVCFDDTPGVPRVKMSCGCILGVGDDCIKRHCYDIVKKGKFLFTCPGCETTWQHSLVRQVLSTAMTTEELKSFTEKVTSNFALDCPTMQSCPKCDNYITHDPQKAKGFRNKFWVRCPICTRNEHKSVEFCWVCLNPWKGNNLSCGNDICTGKDPRIQTLQTCGTRSIYNIHNVPIYRACVKCGGLIEHTEKCKHMTCKFCKCQFCFVCLKPKIEDTGQWQCGSFKSVCEVAPRQTSLFVTI